MMFFSTQPKLGAPNIAVVLELAGHGPSSSRTGNGCTAGLHFFVPGNQSSFSCAKWNRDALLTRASTRGALEEASESMSSEGKMVIEDCFPALRQEDKCFYNDSGVADSQSGGLPFEEDVSLECHSQWTGVESSRVGHLRLDDLDMQKDFRRRPFRPRIKVDSPPPRCPPKPGKRQNIPPKAKQMIFKLRDLSVEDFAAALSTLKHLNAERADWLYVLRYFHEKEEKSMLLEVFKFVLLEPAFEASARDYTNLIRVLVRLGDSEAVEHTLKLMVERGVFPDLVTFTVIIGFYGKLGNLYMVKKKFEQLKFYGLVPDNIIYCALIEAYSQLGYAKKAESIMEAMQAAGLSLKIEIFISLIRGYGIIGQVKDAERVFQLMQANLFYPERRSYSALMDAYTKDEDVERAIQVFTNMVAVGIEPTDKALARLVIACEKKNMLREAMEVMETLENKSFKLGTYMLSSLKEWLKKLELHREVNDMTVELEKRVKLKMFLAKKWNAYLPSSYSLY
ncbi:hypothetical protein KP509_32G002500 [Ceratopteris richardii]|uniref:PROP1-like PPR domain-containing protein n=2 Tax=Ceratopteris richardii TaxID=49495 RepID=A0A8T2QS96_CERRI|nr:hypothetical protein KP509_32G002500 [Ceratopteris richardii]